MSGVRVSTSTEEGDVQRTFHSIALELVGGRYIETLGAPLVRGRTFKERDSTGGGAEDTRELGCNQSDSRPTVRTSSPRYTGG